MSHRFPLICAALVAGTIFPATAANASVTVNITESGPNVVATASGTLVLNGLVGLGGGVFERGTNPSAGFIAFGFSSTPIGVVYSGFSGPLQFGSGGFTPASPAIGTEFVISGSCLGGLGCLAVPLGYSSGSPISSTETFSGSSFASLGLTPGQYVYSWQFDTVTVNIGQVAGGVPEPSTWAMMLIGFAGIGMTMRYRFRGGNLPQMA